MSALELHAVVSGPEAGASAEVPLVMLHGLFGQARNFGGLARVFARERQVVALDLRSHGSSPAGPLALREMATDVTTTLRTLGIERAVLLGHSLGGKVAMALALTEPAIVERLIVADIAPVAYRHGNRRLVRALQALTLSPGLTRAQADRALAASVADPAVRGLLLQNLVTGPEPHWRFGLEEIGNSVEEAEGWPADWPDGTRWDGPALFILGGGSDYVRETDWPLVRRLFPGAQRVTIEGAGHWLHAERPDVFAASVQAFLA